MRLIQPTAPLLGQSNRGDRITLNAFTVFVGDRSAVMICYFGVSLNTNNLSGDRFKNGAFVALVEVPGMLLSMVLIKRFGSRISYAVVMAATSFFLALVPIFMYASKSAEITSVLLCD